MWKPTFMLEESFKIMIKSANLMIKVLKKNSFYIPFFFKASFHCPHVTHFIQMASIYETYLHWEELICCKCSMFWSKSQKSWSIKTRQFFFPSIYIYALLTLGCHRYDVYLIVTCRVGMSREKNFDFILRFNESLPWIMPQK